MRTLRRYACALSAVAMALITLQPLVQAHASTTADPTVGKGAVSASRHHAFGGGVPSVPTTGMVHVFTGGGYYMTPLPSSAPIDSRSNSWISSIQSKSIIGGIHIYFAHDTAVAKPSDKACTTNGYSYHVPSGFQTDSGGRGAIIDPTTNWAVGTVNGMSNGCLASVQDAYHVNSNGLASNVKGGTAGNTGHRGASSGRKALLPDEVFNLGVPTASLGERMQCSAPISPNTNGEPYAWPLSGGDAGSNVTYPVPEGAVIRIKPSVAIDSLKTSPEVKAVLHGLQTYGCLVVDGGSQKYFNIIFAENGNWKFPDGNTITENALAIVPFSSYEFVQTGYDPVSGSTNGGILFNCKGTPSGNKCGY